MMNKYIKLLSNKPLSDFSATEYRDYIKSLSQKPPPRPPKISKRKKKTVEQMNFVLHEEK